MGEKTKLSAVEERIYNQGERLIPGVTHDTAEVVRHKSGYQFFRKIIESDLLSGCFTGRAHLHILDIGCGVGHGTHMLADIPGAIVTGIDCSEDTIKYARTYYSRENITYIVADAARFLESMPEFDYVVSRHALEHIPDGITAAAASKFSARLMVNVPFQEAEGNPHHHVHFISEDSFLGYESAEILYEDLGGVTYYERPEDPTPNSIICVSSKSAFAKVKQIIFFPVASWRPEFLQGRWLEVFDKRGDPESHIQALEFEKQAARSRLDEVHRTAARLQNELEMTQQSLSWRATAPLRAGRRAVDSLLSRFRSPPATRNLMRIIRSSVRKQGIVQAVESEQAKRDIGPRTARPRVLLFSYAFPPMQVQMTPAVIKPMAAFGRQGYDVDVLCAASFLPFLGRDESLLPYAERHFGTVTRLFPRDGLHSRLFPPDGLPGKLGQRLQTLSRVPDLMTVLQGRAFDTLMAMDLQQYEAIITWSPFHSINPVMVRVKKHRPEVRWLAQFSDPWAGNPLEWSKLAKLWNWWHEPRAVRAADFIVHSSRYSRDLMMNGYAAELVSKTEVIPHPFDEELYPARPKTKNEQITLRYIGVLYGRRSPEPLFIALAELLGRRRDLRDRLLVEFVGLVPPGMLSTAAARSLPGGMVTHVPGVSYIESLEKMYDADILLLIEADIRRNLFLPSKLSDYIGARTPIVGIAPPGASEDILKRLKCWHARPSDIEGIARAVGMAVDYVASGTKEPWCDESYRHEFSNDLIAERFINVLKKLDKR